MNMTMTTISPHATLHLFTPDEIAECWDGVYSFGDLYEQLWACVQRYEPIDREDCGPHDVIGINSVASFWSSFSAPNQARLNELAAARDEEYLAFIGLVNKE